MQRLSGRLREVVAYKNRTTAGRLFRENIRAHLLYGRLTWDQALFSFGFENYIPAGKAKRKESGRR